MIWLYRKNLWRHLHERSKSLFEVYLRRKKRRKT